MMAKKLNQNVLVQMEFCFLIFYLLCHLNFFYRLIYGLDRVAGFLIVNDTKKPEKIYQMNTNCTKTS
jgi:hypothetical protein